VNTAELRVLLCTLAGATGVVLAVLLVEYGWAAGILGVLLCSFAVTWCVAVEAHHLAGTDEGGEHPTPHA